MKRSPIKTDPAKVRAWKERSAKRLPRASTKRKAQEKERTEFRKVVLRRRPMCEARLPMYCEGASTEVNELQRGPAREDCWLDWDKVTALCSPCHRWLTDHPRWAYFHGHQLPHEGQLTQTDWDIAAALRGRFRKTPCKPTCTTDHWRFGQ